MEILGSWDALPDNIAYFFYSLIKITCEPSKIGVLFLFYRWRNELRPREGKLLSEGDTVTQWQSRDLKLYALSPESHELTFPLYCFYKSL